MTNPEFDDDAGAYRRRGAAQAAALQKQARSGGLRFEAYLPPALANWILDKIARGVFADPSEAAFVILGEHHELEPHTRCLRQEALRRSLQAAADDPRPGIPAEEFLRGLQQTLAAPQPELAVWPGRA